MVGHCSQIAVISDEMQVVCWFNSGAFRILLSQHHSCVHLVLRPAATFYVAIVCFC